MTNADATTLTGFLLARIAEDEAAAREALPAAHPTARHLHVARNVNREDGPLGVTGDLIVTPARVLMECEAKRRIVSEHGSGADPCDAHDADYGTIPCDTLLHLAAVYADYPGYQPEWATL